tara:strand:- start:832 stop:1239 length:408 start_codon:yes stop_codon:yes gene_type:complete
MIQHHIIKDGESYLPHSFGGMLYPVPLSTMLKKRFRDVSIKGLPTYSMIPVGYGKPVTDGVHVKIPPPPPPPPMTEFEKSLAWMKEFIDDVEHDARLVCEDESESWLGSWTNPTKEDFLKHLAVVSKGESSPDVS